MKKLNIVYSHGRRGAKGKGKSVRLLKAARELGHHTLEVEYLANDSIPKWINKCQAACSTVQDNLVLVGSSLGAFVSIEISKHFSPCGMFLLAPALGLDGYPTLSLSIKHPNVQIIHGWRDRVVNPLDVVKYAQFQLADLLVINDGHDLRNSLDIIEGEFRRFLNRLSEE